MHRVLLEHPEHVQARERLEELHRRERAWRLDVNRRLTAYDEDRRRWEQESLAAAERGEPLPDAPAQPEVANLTGQFQHQREQLHAELERVEQRIAPQVEQAAAERESELLTELAPKLEALGLDEVVDELGLLLQTVGFVRRRVDPRSGSPGDRTRQAVGLEEVVAAAVENRSLLAPEHERRRAPVEREPGPVDPEVAARMRAQHEPSDMLRLALAKHRADRTDPRRR
jgi:hypothetical protein